jgi:RNA polymerase sigma-70 factor (ECF subfamily)
MFRIARNLFLNDIRARNIRTAYAAESVHHTPGAVDGERVLESQLTYDAVCRFISALPEEQRSTLLLVAVEGLSYREASDILGVPIGTVTSRLARGRAALKSWVEDPPPEKDANDREIWS